MLLQYTQLFPLGNNPTLMIMREFSKKIACRILSLAVFQFFDAGEFVRSHYSVVVFLSCVQLCVILTKNSFVNLFCSLTTGPETLGKRVDHRMGARVPSFNFQDPIVSLTSSSSRLRLFHRPPVTSIPSFYLSLNNVFQTAVPTQDVTKSISLPSFRRMYNSFVLDSM